jgi:hypothetical protein
MVCSKNSLAGPRYRCCCTLVVPRNGSSDDPINTHRLGRKSLRDTKVLNLIAVAIADGNLQTT